MELHLRIEKQRSHNITDQTRSWRVGHLAPQIVCVCVCVCLSVCHTIRWDAEWRWWNKLLSSNIGSGRTWKHSSGPCHILTHPRCDSADWYHDAWTVSTYRNIIFIINTSQQSKIKRCVYFNFIKLSTFLTEFIFYFPTILRTKKAYFAIKF